MQELSQYLQSCYMKKQFYDHDLNEKLVLLMNNLILFTDHLVIDLNSGNRVNARSLRFLLECAKIFKPIMSKEIDVHLAGISPLGMLEFRPSASLVDALWLTADRCFIYREMIKNRNMDEKVQKWTPDMIKMIETLDHMQKHPF